MGMRLIRPDLKRLQLDMYGAHSRMCLSRRPVRENAGTLRGSRAGARCYNQNKPPLNHRPNPAKPGQTRSESLPAILLPSTIRSLQRNAKTK